jgi:hypothetical protein
VYGWKISDDGQELLLRLRRPNFRIPDFALGGLAVTILFAIGLLTAFPDMPYVWLWEAIVALGAITWALGSGFLERPENAGGPKSTVRSQYIPHGPSTDFAALINAITAQGEANRQEERREDNSRRFREWLTIALLVGTVYLLNSQVSEMKKVYPEIQGQAVATGNQLEIMKQEGRALVGPTGRLIPLTQGDL